MKGLVETLLLSLQLQMADTAAIGSQSRRLKARRPSIEISSRSPE